MDPTGRRAALALLSLAAIWGAALPWLACLSHSSAIAATGYRAAFALGSVICHQRPERSFFSCSRQWPVCGRCSGLYLGAAAGALAAVVLIKRSSPDHASAPHAATRQWRGLLVVAAVPTVVLLTLEAAGLLDPGNAGRFAGALPLGLGTTLWLSAVARGDLR
jgi:uncharacterized membrane protein